MNTDSPNKPDPMAEDELKQEIEKYLFNFLKDYIDSVDKRFYNVTDNLEVHSSIERPKFEQLVNAYTTNKIIEELEAIPLKPNFLPEYIQYRLAELRKTL